MKRIHKALFLLLVCALFSATPAFAKTVCKSEADALEALKAVADAKGGSFTLYCSDSLYKSLSGDSLGGLYGLVVRAGMLPGAVSYESGQKVFSCSDITHFDFTYYCTTEDDVRKAFALLASGGYEQYMISCSGKLFDQLAADNWKGIYRQAARAGVQPDLSSYGSYGEVSCIFGTGYSVIENGFDCQTMADVENALKAVAERRDQNITLICSDKLYAQLCADNMAALYGACYRYGMEPGPANLWGDEKRIDLSGIAYADFFRSCASFEDFRDALREGAESLQTEMLFAYTENGNTVDACSNCGLLDYDYCIMTNAVKIIVRQYRLGWKLAHQPKEGIIWTEREQAAIKVARAAAEQIAGEAGSVLERERMLHDWICQNTTYVDEIANSFEDDCARGVFIDGAANCDGYSDAFYALCWLLNIPCEYVIGEKIGDGSHMWNMVQINGKWYMTDVTFDSTDTKLWFNGGTDIFRRSHIWNDDALYRKPEKTAGPEVRVEPEYRCENIKQVRAAMKECRTRGYRRFSVFAEFKTDTDALYDAFFDAGYAHGTCQPWDDMRYYTFFDCY